MAEYVAIAAVLAFFYGSFSQDHKGKDMVVVGIFSWNLKICNFGKKSKKQDQQHESWTYDTLCHMTKYNKIKICRQLSHFLDFNDKPSL